VPGRHPSAASPSGSSSCTIACASRFETAIANSEIVFLVAVIRKDAGTSAAEIGAGDDVNALQFVRVPERAFLTWEGSDIPN